MLLLCLNFAVQAKATPQLGEPGHEGPFIIISMVRGKISYHLTLTVHEESTGKKYAVLYQDGWVKRFQPQERILIRIQDNEATFINADSPPADPDWVCCFLVFTVIEIQDKTPTD